MKPIRKTRGMGYSMEFAQALAEMQRIEQEVLPRPCPKKMRLAASIAVATRERS